MKFKLNYASQNWMHNDGAFSFARSHNDEIARENQRLFDILHPNHQDCRGTYKHRERVIRWAKNAKDHELETVMKEWHASPVWKEEASSELAKRKNV